MDPLRPADILTQIESDLTEWAADRSAYVSIAGDPGELLECLVDAPNKLRLVILWGGDEDQTGTEESGIVTNTVEVWMIKAKGLRLKPGDHLVRGDNPYLAVLSDLRSRLRSLSFFPGEDVTYGRMLYKGCKPYPNPEMAFDLPTVGYVLRFELISVVPYEDFRG